MQTTKTCGTLCKVRSGGWARSGAIALAVLAGLIGGRTALADSIYTFTSLGPADPNTSVAINNSKEVVGTSGGKAAYTNVVPPPLPQPPLTPLGGSSPPASSQARGLNDGGVVAGSYYATPGGSQTGFYATSSSGALTSLPTTFGGTAGGAVTNFASAVNGTNSTTFEVVGQATYNGNGPSRAFAWNGDPHSPLVALDQVATDGSGTPINTGLGGGAGGSSAAYGINSAGRIVGQASSSGADNPSHAFLYDPGESKMFDLGSLGNTTDGVGDSNALAINASGAIVGWTDDVVAGNDYSPRAFLIKSGYNIPANDGTSDQSLGTTMVDLGTLQGGYATSQALAINASGIVVGWSQDSDGDPSHAFIYDSSAADPSMVDLNNEVPGLSAEGWTLNSATGVNDAGDITGYATDMNPLDGMNYGQTFAFVLTPAAAVPEPAFGGIGVFALVALDALLFKVGAKKRSIFFKP